jgi:hypothetical protein
MFDVDINKVEANCSAMLAADCAENEKGDRSEWCR